MKKMFFFAAAAAATLSMTACGSTGLGNGEIDTISYAIGADLGLNLNFGMRDLNLDNEAVKESIKKFYKNGDLESEELTEVRNRMNEFQASRMMPYLYAKHVQSSIETDRPDTLPELPVLYDEEFTREEVSRLVGTNMGAWVKSIGHGMHIKSLMRAVDDGLKLESETEIDSLMLLNNDQMRNAFMALQAAQQKKAMEAREKALKENAEASAAWLQDVEKMEGVVKTESGLLYRIDREGTGAQAVADSNVVEVNYEGKTRTGKIFDSSYERGSSISFPLNGVIKGWTEGMKYVKEGGQITLWIPSELAYGERGAGSDIGPNEALEFKVELIKVTF
jgi:FKBP-type peptidyl-prolyl cis-trans isomerase FkpA